MSTPNDILGLPSGAEWLKADLHVHTPASQDMADNWKNSTPADVVRIANEKGLDVIGITDHNTAAWCDLVRQAADGSPVTVFPGVEISTPEGHLLALFDGTVSSAHIEDLLIAVGIPRDKFGDLDVATEGGISSVSAAIAKAGGVAVAAHADGERGFLKMIKVGEARRRAYLTQELWAMEILDKGLREEYQSEARYPRRLTCVQSSDCWPKGANSHQLDGMAYRHTFLKMDDRSISGLKLALIDPDIRVRLADDDSPSVSYSILGMWVTSGFLDGQKMRFNDNVSCFIGDTGSGKSVAIELLRFGLDQQAGVQKLQREIESLLEQQLGNLGVVHVLISRGSARYLVERAWGKPRAAPVVQRLTDSGLQPLDEVDVRLFFPIKGFSQSEIIEFAREPEVRLSLTDDLIDCSTELASINELKAGLRRNAAEITTEQAKEDNMRSQLSERPSLVEDVERIDAILTDPLITKQQLWYSEQKVFKDAKQHAGLLNDKVADLTVPLNLAPLWPDDMSSLPNQDLLAKVKKAYQDWQDHLGAMRDSTKAKLVDLVENVKLVQAQWSERFDKAEADYRQLLAQLDKDGVGLQALSERRKGIQQRISILEEIDQTLQNDIRPRIQRMKTERQGLLDKLQRSRRAITKKREEKAKGLSAKLSHKIRLQVHGRANTTSFGRVLADVAQGSYLHRSDLDTLAVKCHPVSLVNRMLALDFDGVAAQSGLEASKIARLWETILDRDRLEELYELQLTDVEDVIEVQLEVAQGNYRRLEDLSHGQKCMVVLMVALAEGDFPLLVDQPEDALHAPSIEEGIVSTLRSGRGARQCIFATRNANILVSADAEQIIALQADAKNGQVAGTGSLDRFDHRQLIIYHVEGGEDAFRRRKTMYALEPSP